MPESIQTIECECGNYWIGTASERERLIRGIHDFSANTRKTGCFHPTFVPIIGVVPMASRMPSRNGAEQTFETYTKEINGNETNDYARRGVAGSHPRQLDGRRFRAGRPDRHDPRNGEGPAGFGRSRRHRDWRICLATPAAVG